MSVKNINSVVRHRRDTAAEWIRLNPLLLDGEIGFESETGLFKIGDGVLRWNQLPYFNIANILSNEPNAQSTHNQIASARVLHEMMGLSVQSLLHPSRQIVPAINGLQNQMNSWIGMYDGEIFYQEGNFTPTLRGTTRVGNNITYHTRIGRFRKIGRNVFITVHLDVTNPTGTSQASAAGDIQLIGLPIVPDGAAIQAGLSVFQTIHIRSTFAVMTPAYVRFRATTAANTGNMGNVQWIAGRFTLVVGGSYSIL